MATANEAVKGFRVPRAFGTGSPGFTGPAAEEGRWA